VSVKVTVKDGVWKQLLARAHDLDKAHAKVGVLSEKGGDAAHGDGDITMTELMAIHEFGSEAANIPERAPIRTTFAENEGETVEICAKLSKAVVTGGMPARKALGLLGAWGAAQVKKRITEGEHLPPPNAPATIARKGSERPLVDTGRLVGAINYEVVDE
jgi:hypothetical protein